MRLAPIVAALVLAIGAPAAVLAQAVPIALRPATLEALPLEARTFYEQAVRADDHISYDEAAMLLGKAAEKAPANIELQFVTLGRARDLAEVYYGQAMYSISEARVDYSSPPWRTAEPFFDIADAALQRLLASPDLTPEQQTRVAREKARLEKQRTNKMETDGERTKTALPLLLQLREARLEVLGRGAPTKEVDGGPGLDASKTTGSDENAGFLASILGDGAGQFVDPFAKLPGEEIPSFLPPPPAQPGQPGAPPSPFGGFAPPTGATSPFGDPNAPPAGESPFGGADDPNAAPADGTAPAGGENPAPPADAAPPADGGESPFS